MPRREATKRVEGGPQGEDAWAEFRRFTVGEMEAIAARATEDGRNSLQMGMELLRAHLLRWNWADEAGAPLPQPAADPAVIEGLTVEELNFLAEAMRFGPKAELKN